MFFQEATAFRENIDGISDVIYAVWTYCDLC